MFGVNGGEILIILLVILLVVGPSRLPEYAEQLKNLVRFLKRRASDAKSSVVRDFGEDFSDVDWRKLDPRQYDPRRIVREALMEDEDAGASSGTSAGGVSATGSSDKSGQGTTGTTAGVATGTGAAVAGLSPLERFRQQAAKRVSTEAAPFDNEAT